MTHFANECVIYIMKKSTNMRVLDSQKRIANAMLFLLKLESFENITITQLTQEAGVSRKTFYRNYNHKIEVLDYVLDDVFKEFQENLYAMKKLSNIEVTRVYFRIWYLNSSLVKTFIKNDLMHIIDKFHSEKIKNLYEEFYCSTCQNRDDYSNSIIVGTYYNLLKQWANDNFSMNVEDISYLYTKVIMNLGKR